MSDTLRFTPTDRILVVAPHPDDESIATGGLIQAARAAGAAVRVIVLTDGDANVWPQRWIEKRWRIDAAARARWGARRREEARQAMRVLGLRDGDAVFFGLPDLGLTDLLMRADASVPARLRVAIAEFAPTCIVLPSLADRHPDHSAANVLVRLALDGSAGTWPRLLAFAVHGGGADATVVCELDIARQQCKRDAILAHATQMRLSRRRFLGHVGPTEDFAEAAAIAVENPRHPLRASAGADGRVCIRVDARQARRGLALFVVLDGGPRPCRVLVPWRSGRDTLQAHDIIGGEPFGIVRVERAGTALTLSLQTGCTGWRQGFVKYARPVPGWRVFDRYGWQAIMRS